MTQSAEDARNNFCHGKNVHKKHDQIKGVDEVIEIYSDSDSDYDEDGDYIPRMVKRVDSDSRDDGYKVHPDENQDDVFIENVNEVEYKKSPRLGRGHRTRTQTTTNYVYLHGIINPTLRGIPRRSICIRLIALESLSSTRTRYFKDTMWELDARKIRE